MSYLLQRILGAFLVLFAVSTLVFFVVRWVPGDPVESILGEFADQSSREALRECLHLEESLFAQYWYYLGDLADGSLGHFCHDPDVTVRDSISAVLPATIQLAAASILVALFLSIPLGVLAALRQGSFIDLFALTVAMLGVSIPNFWLGPMLLLAFSVSLQVFPDPGASFASLSSLILPALTLGTALAAKLTRMTRASVLEVLREDYIRTARAKGLRERVVVFKHALRNALMPITSVLGLQIGGLLSGAIIVEKVFGRPGLGFELLEAIEQRNYMLVQGCVLTISFVYVMVNLLTDLAYTAIDPRVRLGERAP